VFSFKEVAPSGTGFPLPPTPLAALPPSPPPPTRFAQRKTHPPRTQYHPPTKQTPTDSRKQRQTPHAQAQTLVDGILAYTEKI